MDTIDYRKGVCSFLPVLFLHFVVCVFSVTACTLSTHSFYRDADHTQPSRVFDNGIRCTHQLLLKIAFVVVRMDGTDCRVFPSFLSACMLRVLYGYDVGSRPPACTGVNGTRHPLCVCPWRLDCRMDDLGDQFPTYVARRHPFSRRYGPINKADVITKWLNSVDAPQEEVIVVIDPDNWFTGSIRPWVDKVKKGQAVAQAAFYAGSTVQVTKLWQIFCKKNCDFKLDMAAVPYLMHRDDWKEVAPLWKMYSIMIKEHMESHPGFEKQFPSLQVGWCAEMYGYVFGAAHAGVPHIIENRLQLRDVGPRLGPEVTKNVPFLHMGRIWFPKSYGCKKWCHTSGHEFDGYGMQVWCKCNTTASDVIPWPPAPGMDFVSAKTLEYLHDSREKYGPIPASKFRPDPYHGSLP
eukprot:m.120901 g.120901  ORF g.120901 m.120901 type:complete len:406 (+) comp17257_c0_seq4:894-2111(+)